MILGRIIAHELGHLLLVDAPKLIRFRGTTVPVSPFVGRRRRPPTSSPDPPGAFLLSAVPADFWRITMKNRIRLALFVCLACYAH